MADIGKFEVLAPLGQGAGSTILKIRRAADDRVYALKVVTIADPEDLRYVEQVENEYEIGRELEHPNIVQIFGMEKSRRLLRISGAKLWMEFIDGLPLARLGKLPLLRLVAIYFRVAAGMTYLHQRGIFHADLKPDNIMVGTSHEVKIIDLGLAWRRGQKKERVQGTLEFLAPEQAHDRIVTEKTDIYNFGAAMYRTLTGDPVPEQLRDRQAARLGDVDAFVRPLSTHNEAVPSALDELVRQCVRFDPAERPTSMREIRDRLAAIGKSLKR